MARLDDGYQTLISAAADPTVLFYEKTVKPPGVDGGGGIDTTTMLNSAYRSMAPKSLITLTNGGMNVAYDPATLSEILALVNVNTLWTITFPNSHTWAFYGFLNKFEPNDLVEGEQPTADIEIVPTNVNGSNVETAPVYS